jgi:hypothetical protein
LSFYIFTASEKNALQRIFAWLDSAREEYLRSATELKQYAAEDLHLPDQPEDEDNDTYDDDDDDDAAAADWRIVGAKRKYEVKKEEQFFNSFIFKEQHLFMN